MRIIERFIEGKASDPALCEDGIAVLGGGVAVVDGVTAKTQALSVGVSGGKLACEAILQALPGCIGLADPFSMLCNLNEALRGEAEDEARLSSDSESEAAGGEASADAKASVMVYQAEHSRIVGYGDCQCMINGLLRRRQNVFDELHALERRRVIEAALEAGQTIENIQRNDVGREAIREGLIGQSRYENDADSPCGFPVLNGRPLEVSMMDVYEVHPGDEVVLASDGYPALAPTLAESERLLQEILQRDPLMIVPPHASTKGVYPPNASYDDRCYVRFVV